MDHQIKEKIFHLKNSNSIIELNKGFSDDKKYVIDDKYLLRLFPIEDEKNRKEEFDTLNKLATYSNYVPSGIEFNSLKDIKMAYMILTYLPGKDAEVALKDLTEKEQYTSGFLAGKELKKIHEFSAPSGYPSWYSLKKKKSDNYLIELKKMDLDENIIDMLETYIRNNEAIMKDRPNKFQHDDFHPSNLLINDHTFSGIIDFQRMDWGDPIHDLHKLGFFSKRVSVEFTKGIIDGYHEDCVSLRHSFWELYCLYSVMHIVSALVWGTRRNREQYELLLEYSLDVISDHDHFNRVIPKWYN
ncbi:aminoglycoside phosphotransferase family protein [Metabacillus arenae]|uniref:aminoglycoside phosphotransferase family protein n=1 Tax=Metabacillus arenae TaxID=2771434 RepID=UPI001CD13289|nr:aminoglycoside phosphotransferase family protein [Metabacillus arenae]